MHQLKAFVISLATLGIFGVLLAGCGQPLPQSPVGTIGLTQSRSPGAQSGSSGRLPPVKVAVVQDIVGPHTVPPVQRLRPDDLTPLIDLLKQRGGEIGVGVVDSTDLPIVRLRIDAPPSAPHKTGNVLKDNQTEQEYSKVLKAWTDTTNGSIAAFDEQLTPLLARPAQGDPDIWPTIDRADAFLQESGKIWPAPPQKWLLVVSDRERVARACRDIYGNRTVPPGSEITDTQSGAQYRCMPEGEWSTVAADVTPSTASAAPASPTPTDVLPISPDVHVVAVKAAPGDGPADDRHPTKFGALQDGLRFIVAG